MSIQYSRHWPTCMLPGPVGESVLLQLGAQMQQLSCNTAVDEKTLSMVHKLRQIPKISMKNNIAYPFLWFCWKYNCCTHQQKLSSYCTLSNQTNFGVFSNFFCSACLDLHEEIHVSLNYIWNNNPSNIFVCMQLVC